MSWRILLVDDDVEALRLIGLVLKRRGYEVIPVANGQQAFETIAEGIPDLIILDVMMPGLDGYSIAEKLRSDPETDQVPILFLTARSSIDDRLAGFQAGGDDYLTKPVHPTELISRVEALLKRHARRDAEERRGQLIAFLPVKGGVGTTTAALNSALVLRDLYPDRQTAVVELREGVGSMMLQLGLIQPEHTLSALLEQGAAAVNHDAVDGLMLEYEGGLRVLPATIQPEGLTSTPLTMDFVRRLLRVLIQSYDYIVVDLKPALDKASVEVLRQADHLLLLLEPHQIAVEQGRAVLRALTELNIGQYNFGIVISERTPTTSALGRQAIEVMLGQPVLGILPADPDLAFTGANGGKPMARLQPDSLFVRQIRLIISALVAS